MKIVLKSGQDEYVLVHGPDRTVGNHVGPSGLSHDSDVLAQVDMLLRGNYVKPVLRNNAQINMSFSAHVECADETAAADYAFLYPMSIPRSGELRVQVTTNDVTRTYKISDIVVTRVKPVQHGVSVEVLYQIIGGQVSWLN